MCYSKVLHQAGLTGLWRGCWPNVWRAALVNLGDLSTYDSVKRGILDNSSLEDNTLTHTLSSACAGLVGAIMGTPADVVKASASKSSIRRFVITEKAPTRAFSWLKAATTAFTFKTLLRHFAKRALTPRSLNVKMGPRRKGHKGRDG